MLIRVNQWLIFLFMRRSFIYICLGRIKMKSNFVLLSFLLILFTGCSGITDKPPTKKFLLGDTVTVTYDQTVVNNEENIRLHFITLVSDNRCPVDLECYWEGNAEVKFDFIADGKESAFSLNTFFGYTHDTTITPYWITLVGLEPLPHSKEYLFPGQYRARLLITKRISPYY